MMPAALRILLSYTAILGSWPAASGGGRLFQPVLAERAVHEWDEEDGSEAGDESPLEESLEVHALAHASRHDPAESSWRRKERALQRQLGLTRKERGEAESLQAAEEREVALLERKLEEKDQQNEDLLRSAKEDLAAKSEEVDSAHAAIDHFRGIAGDMQEFAKNATEQVTRVTREAMEAARKASSLKARARQDVAAANAAAARARHEAVLAERKAFTLKAQAERGLAAANAKVARASKAVKKVMRERQQLRRHEGNTLAVRNLYKQKLMGARHAQILAEKQRKTAVAVQQQLANEEYVVVQKERLKSARAQQAAVKAEEQRQKHFKAAATMQAETEEAHSLVLQAGHEKAAAHRERMQALLLKQQAYKEKLTSSMVSVVSLVLVLVVSVVLVLSLEIHKLDGRAKLLSKLQSYEGAGKLLSKLQGKSALAVLSEDGTPPVPPESLPEASWPTSSEKQAEVIPTEEQAVYY